MQPVLHSEPSLPPPSPPTPSPIASPDRDSRSTRSVTRASRPAFPHKDRTICPRAIREVLRNARARALVNVEISVSERTIVDDCCPDSVSVRSLA